MGFFIIRKMNELQSYNKHGLISSIQSRAKEGRLKRIYDVLFHIHKVEKQAELSCGFSSHDSSCLC